MTYCKQTNTVLSQQAVSLNKKHKHLRFCIAQINNSHSKNTHYFTG